MAQWKSRSKKRKVVMAPAPTAAASDDPDVTDQDVTDLIVGQRIPEWADGREGCAFDWTGTVFMATAFLPGLTAEQLTQAESTQPDLALFNPDPRTIIILMHSGIGWGAAPFDWQRVAPESRAALGDPPYAGLLAIVDSSTGEIKLMRHGGLVEFGEALQAAIHNQAEVAGDFHAAVAKWQAELTPEQMVQRASARLKKD